ncbi:zinc carboxypeptidase [Burkholderia cenocepacia]|uniref:zinc carboxypeptidase n=1 Tax=Burkholderia cenocepacia TaxID=95486 RepID=UPI002856DDBC|nr:zinc carboxypeptidase [Burkholderia cenocepacia]MDR8050284.1 zinc carboxypeptidase [Burkholderia cenocepacia]
MSLPLSIVDEVADRSGLRTYQQMVVHTQKVLERYADLVTVTRVGISGQGEPIDMISIGDGPMSALFVGAPHPHELVGCLMIEQLIDRLCVDSEFRCALPYRWHFIKAIEPDALRLNEGWFSSPGDLLRFHENFYWPPLDQQAEYTFPFDDDDRLARHPMPENAAWRKAIELAKPDFLYSLHNTGFGGAYFIASEMPAGLADTLKALCATHGVTLNPVGDAGIQDRWGAGIFRFPDMRTLRPDNATPTDPGTRTLGNSSAGYVRSSGTFELIAEVPYWDSDRLRDSTESTRSRADIEAELGPLTDEVMTLAQQALSLDCAASHPVGRNMWRVVRTHCSDFANRDRTVVQAPARDQKLTWAEYTIRRVGGTLERLTTVALARRFALLSLDRTEGFRLATECDRVLAAQIDALIHQEGLRPVPFKQLVQFQRDAGLAVMRKLAERPRAAA